MSTLCKKLFSLFYVCLTGFFSAVKKANVIALAVDHYSGKPFASLLAPVGTNKTGGASSAWFPDSLRGIIGPAVNHSKWMNLVFGNVIGRLCQFFGVEITKVDYLLAGRNLSVPSAVRPKTNPKNFGFAIRVRSVLVLHILLSSRLSEVVDSIVRTHSVFMVYKRLRERSIDISPSQYVRKILAAVYANSYVSVICFVPRNAASLHSPLVAGPSKHAGFLVVVKQFSQACCGKIGLSHDAVLSLIGQRPIRVSSTDGLRYFMPSAAINKAVW